LVQEIHRKKEETLKIKWEGRGRRRKDKELSAVVFFPRQGKTKKRVGKRVNGGPPSDGGNRKSNAWEESDERSHAEQG